MKKYINRKSVLITSIALLLLVSVGATLAYIFTMTDPLVNQFKPSKVTSAVVETVKNTVYEYTNGKQEIDTSAAKKDVQIRNTGDTDAYIRVAVVVTWKNQSGNVWATKPTVVTTVSQSGDCFIDWAFDDDTNPTDWFEKDGYYYFKNPVKPSELTDILINSAKVNSVAPASNYYLSVEIVASAIQANPTSVVESEWGVTVGDDGTINQ